MKNQDSRLFTETSKVQTLLDGDLNPKISDFGLAKLHEEEKTHISTRVAGTMLVFNFFIFSTTDMKILVHILFFHAST